MSAIVLILAALVANGGFEEGASSWRLGKKTCSIVPDAGLKSSSALVWENDDPKYYAYATQSFDIEPGCAYSFSGWIKDCGTTNATRKGRVTNISVEWRDTEGKFIGMAGSNAIVDNQETEEGWVKFFGKTAVMPSNAKTGTLVCSALRGSVGKVVFDNLEVTQLDAEPLPGMISSAYRDMAASGKVTFAARCVLNPLRDPPASVSAEFSFVGKDGAFMRKSGIAAGGIAKAEVAVDTLALGKHPVEVALKRRDGSVISKRRMDFTRLAEMPKRKVYIDEYGRTIVDGKAFFPLGLYSSRREVTELDTYCEGPFNCILPYALKPEANELDAYAKKDLKVIVCVSDYSGFRGSKLKGADDERAYAMRYLEAFKDHPAVLAWYLADELPEAKIGCLRSRNLLFRAQDMDHPTFVVFDRVDSPADFVEGYDIVGMDPYPIGNAGLRSNIDSASLFPEAAKKAMHSFRGLWQVPQAFDWSWHRPWAVKESGAHMPTLAELRNMNWQAVASGANGLVGWWFPGMVRNLRAKGKTAEFAEAWGNVKTAYGEVAEKVPLILSVESAPEIVSKSVGISARVWRKDGELWLLVVNRTYAKVSGKVGLSDGKTVNVALEGLEHRFVKISEEKAQAARQPWSHLDFKDDSQDFRFAIVPDRTGGDYRGAFTNALECCNLMHPAFVMSVGDLVQGHADEKGTRRMQDELTNFISRLEAPFFYTIGNHDICVNTNTNKPNDRTKHTMTTRVWKEYFGDRTYYSFTYKGCLFVVLNGQEGRLDWAHIRESITAEQYAWLRETLDKHKDARWTFLFMHQPDIWGTKEWAKLERETLLPRKYTVFAGDWHNYFHIRRHDRDYYVLSVAGGVGSEAYRRKEKDRSKLYGVEYGEFDHITWVTMTDNGPKVVNLKLDGILPGDFLNATNTKDLHHVRTRSLDIPPRKKDNNRR